MTTLVTSFREIVMMPDEEQAGLLVSIPNEMLGELLVGTPLGLLVGANTEELVEKSIESPAVTLVGMIVGMPMGTLAGIPREMKIARKLRCERRNPFETIVNVPIRTLIWHKFGYPMRHNLTHK